MDETFLGAKILIVDDNVLNLKLISSILSAQHYQVRTVSNALRMFDALEHDAPDLILLDVMMPEKSGYELCTSIKQDRRFASIPVIFLTALNDSASIIKCFNVGGADYLSKPVSPPELLARINTHLNLKMNVEKLWEARRELETFNQMISHDLKSPILLVHKLAGYLEGYRDKISDPDYTTIIRGIQGKTSEIACSMEKYSELARLSYRTPQMESIDLNALMEEIFTTQAEGTPAVLWMDDLPTLLGDRVLLKNAFTNVISNALKFSRERHPPIIEVRCRMQEHGLQLCIRDNGVGFDMKYADNLFQMFTRMHTQEEFEGTGTGLAIVKKILDLLGGDVWIEAVENQGATVFFTFPPVLLHP